MSILSLLLIVLSCFKLIVAFSEEEAGKLLDLTSDSDEPLILTSYLEQGRTSEGRNAASVRPLVGTVRSFSGYFTVDTKYDSNIFFWYFPSETNPSTAPVACWLHGGPGESSMLGLFNEHGPFELTNGDRSVRKRNIYWSKSMHLIYFDNPVGTGFSFTNSSDGYPSDETTIGNQLYSALQQFFAFFPEVMKNDFYVTGEGYGGKYVPALSHTIHINNPTATFKINLKGLAVGNGFTDPINQIDYGIYLYEISLIDESQKRAFDMQQDKAKALIEKQDWLNATIEYRKLIRDPNNMLMQFSGFTNIFNFLLPDDDIFSGLDTYLNMISVQRQIHVGRRTYSSLSLEVLPNLYEDMTQSLAPWMSTLVDNYKVLLYFGELDIAEPYPLAENYLSKLNWCGADEYATADRRIWRVNGQLAGYIRSSAPDNCNGSLSNVLVRNAGHNVASYQPLWTYQLVSNFMNANSAL